MERRLNPRVLIPTVDRGNEFDASEQNRNQSKESEEDGNVEGGGHKRSAVNTHSSFSISSPKERLYRLIKPVSNEVLLPIIPVELPRCSLGQFV